MEGMAQHYQTSQSEHVQSRKQIDNQHSQQDYSKE
jgi:hypothetical protein